MTWIANPQAYTYNIYKRTSFPPGDYQLTTTVPYSIVHYFDNFAQPKSTEYDYAIVACTSSGNCGCDPNSNCNEDSYVRKLKPHVQYTYEGELNGNLSIYTTKKAFGDVNGDGFTDAIFLSQKPDKSFELKLSINSLGTLQEPKHLADTGDCVGEPVIRDLDGDGFLDVLYCYHDANISQWRILPGNGSGTFKEAIVFPGDYYQAEISDIDRDGDLDIILGSYGKGIMLWQNNTYIDSQHITNWNFASTQLTDATNYYVTNLKVIDIDNDSYDDIVVAGFSLDLSKNPTAFHKMLINKKNNLFSESSWDNDSLMLVTLMEVADFDGDGYPDMVIGIQEGDLTGNLKFYKNNAQGGFNSPVEAIKYSKTAFSKVNDYSSIASGDIGDIDNDGDMDIIIPGHWIQCYPPSDPLIPCYAIVPGGLILRNLGDGTFAFFDESAGTHHIYGSVLVDLNNDGDLDALLNLDLPAPPISSRKTPQQNNSVLIYTNRESDASTPNEPYGDNPNNKPAAPDLSRITNITFNAQDIEFDYNFAGSNPDDKTNNNDLFCNLYIGTTPRNQNIITDDIYQAEVDDIYNYHNSLNNGSFPCGANHFLKINRNDILNKAKDHSTLNYSIQFVDQNQRRSLWATEGSFSIDPNILLQPPIDIHVEKDSNNNIIVSWLPAPSPSPSPSGYIVYWGSASHNYLSNSGEVNTQCPSDQGRYCYIISLSSIKNTCAIYVAVTSVIDNPYQESVYSQEVSFADIINPTDPSPGGCTKKHGPINTEIWNTIDYKCYYIDADLIINEGQTLTIAEGVCIYVADSKKITANPNAKIKILGTGKDQVVMKPIDSASLWYGFDFPSYSNVNFEIHYAQIKGFKHIHSTSTYSMLSISDSYLEGNYVSDDSDKFNIIYSRSNIQLFNTIIKGNGCTTQNDPRNLVNMDYTSITLYMTNSSLINNITPSDCTHSSAVRAVVLASGARIDGAEFSNKIYQIKNNDYNNPGEDGIYINSGYYDSDLILKPLGYNCENSLCDIIPYYVFDGGSINIYKGAYLILNKSRLIFKSGSIYIGYESQSTGGIIAADSKISGKINFYFGINLIPYIPSENIGSRILNSSIIGEANSSYSIFEINGNLLLSNNVISSPIGISGAAGYMMKIGIGTTPPTVYLENNTIFDPVEPTTNSYFIMHTSGTLKMESNKFYYMLNSSDVQNYFRGIEWHAGDIISSDKNNLMFKKICINSICNDERIGIHFMGPLSPFRYEDLNLMKLGYGCEIPADCPNSYIPFYIDSSFSLGKPRSQAFINIDEGLDVYLKEYTTITIGFYANENKYGGIRAIGSALHPINIYMKFESKIYFDPRTIGYNEKDGSGSMFNYVTFINIDDTANNGSYLIHEAKDTVYYQNCIFHGLWPIEFIYINSVENDVNYQYFKPQGLFKYCTFQSMKPSLGYPNNGIFAPIHATNNANIQIEYSNFYNNKLILEAYNHAKIKIHHCNLDDSNTNPDLNWDKIRIATDALIDARWNYWAHNNHMPSANPQIIVYPYYENEFHADSFHIVESHIDLFSFKNDSANKVAISMKPSSTSDWKISTNCSSLINNGRSVDNNNYGRLDLDNTYLKCLAYPCTCDITIAAPKDNPQSTMKAKIAVKSNILMNSINKPLQSDNVSDKLDFSGKSYGTSGLSWSLFYREFPSRLGMGAIASGADQEINLNNLDFSQYPKGEGYLILSTDISTVNQLERIRHIIVGSGRPTVSLSKQEINVIPSANDSVAFTIGFEEKGNYKLRIYNTNNSNIYLEELGTIDIPPIIMTYDWNGRDHTGQYVPDGIYQAELIFTTQNGTYFYNPAAFAIRKWSTFEYYENPEPPILYSDLGLIIFRFYALKPTVAHVLVDYNNPQLSTIYNSGLYALNGLLWKFSYSNRIFDEYPHVGSPGGLVYLTVGMPENDIIAYGAAPRINFVVAPSSVFKPTIKKLWTSGYAFNINLMDIPQNNQGVKIFIRKCTDPLNASATRMINQICNGIDCSVVWDGKDNYDQYVEEGCYRAEFYGTDNRLDIYESLSPVPWRLFFDVYY